jgi:hypothetical protein
MNLKEIIKEEIDDFQWIKDINPKTEIDLSGTWIIKNDLGDRDPSMFAVQEKLFDLGFSWGGNKKNILDVKSLGFQQMLGIAITDSDEVKGKIIGYYDDYGESVRLLNETIPYMNEVCEASEFLESMYIKV